MTGQTGSQRFMAPEVFDGMPYNEKVRAVVCTTQVEIALFCLEALPHAPLLR